MSETLHSLNSLRVIAEFFVVNGHLAYRFPTTPQPWFFDGFVSDLMSFFFVLSGFVASYTTQSTPPGVDYIRKRVSKTMPLYVFWTSYLGIGFVVQEAWGNQWPCPLVHVCRVMAVGTISQWFFCGTVDNVEGAGWYLATLLYLWIAYPAIYKVLSCKYMDTWPAIGMLWLVSLAPWYLLVRFPAFAAARAFPPFRLCEFVMGCATAKRIGKPLPGWVVVVVIVALLAYHALDQLVFRFYPPTCAMDSLETQCILLPLNGVAASMPCRPVWSRFLSKAALGWALLIHHVASKESAGQPIPFLQWDFFKHLSSFSLHMYLGHTPISNLLLTVIPGVWQPATLILATYLACYIMAREATPHMDRLGDLLTGRHTLYQGLSTGGP